MHCPWLPALLAYSILAACSCTPEAESPPYDFSLRVVSDPDEPLAGAVVRHAGNTLGSSNPEGWLHFNLPGKEGERLALDVTCPDGFRSPESPTIVTLRRAAAGSSPQYEAQCPPQKRRLVVAVRAERGANLPLRSLGREVGRTDGSGAALVLLESYTDDTLELTIDTSQEPKLLPRSPSARFRVAERDDIVVLNQKFELAARAPQRGPRRAAGPVRIQ